MAAKRSLVAARACVLLVAMPGLAYAVAPQRTFVASNGSDANPCSLSMPCRGFATAVATVAPGGEVIVLDSAGYGAFTITKSVSVAAPDGVYAGISVLSGIGIAITTAETDMVTLRGLTITNQGGVSATGIAFLGAGRLLVDRVRIDGMTAFGLDIETPGAIVIRDSVFYGNSEGVYIIGTTSMNNVVIENTTIAESNNIAISMQPNSRVVIDGSRLINTSTNLLGNVGAYAYTGFASMPLEVHISNSTIRGFISGVIADQNSPSCSVSVVDSEITQNGTAISVSNGATVAVQGNRLTQNATVFNVGLGSTLYTGGNNYAAYYGALQMGTGTFAAPSGSY